MKIAIVGSSNLTDEEMDKAMYVILDILEKHPNAIFVTGDAHGVDYITRQLCCTYVKPIGLFDSKVKSWSHPKGFKNRNEKIARNADYVYSIATKIKNTPCYHCTERNHERTGGCWTLKYAKSIGKKGEVIVL